jgi:hypothetical protein
LARRVDALLRVECEMEAVNRRLLGDAARVLLRNHLYRRLGFVRLGDYARERLGVSARTVQAAAWLVKRLDDLPAIAAAFARCEISSSQARVVCRVASIADERRWLELARRCTVEELARHVRKVRGAGSADPDADDGEIDGEVPLTLRIACPARVRALWRHALELASRMAGEPLAAWRAAEAIAAEGASGRPRGAWLGERAAVAFLGLVGFARRDAADGWSTARAREAASSEKAGAAPSTARGAGSTDPGPDDGEIDGEPARAAEMRARRDPRLALTPANPFEVDARLRFAVDALHRNEPRIGALLGLFAARRYHRLFGYSSVDAYVRERLGISARKARALLAIQKTAQRSDAFARAYRGGVLPWTRALTLLPVVDDATAEAWLRRARAVTVRRLGDEVNWVLQMRDACGPDASLRPPPPDARLTSPFTVLARRARRQEMSLAGDGERDGGDVQIGARSGAAGDGAERPAAGVCDAAVGFTGPASVVAFFRDVLDAFAESDAARWRTLERLLFHVVATWERAGRHRDPVFARDGWRCAVPGCTSRRHLQDHHVVYRGRGGGNEQTNRVTACVGHHIYGIHPGIVRAWGMAPDDVHWELGVRVGAPPLLSYVGDRLCPDSTREVPDTNTRCA